ncbi:SDR family NAD(P)-dependent oxidoreductase [Microbispora sp. ATCC PTA-5024]|uniref:SDR family NAD(P)-dependent oxidoreductase n=1 Tax=Microbispora sp. ATCC PTA-5024 TaxID=316330 RepID=UPI0003DDA0C7|nr:SDR family NAD(P)-dependent oxidoreductase [Microbispora sp. ATCC PTA-5024]ETK34961.1 short-chain dehydrogenase [Microbispora sp. ATCC PTA-5024]
MKGRLVVVTGAASGIGRATALAFAAAGARVVGADLMEPADGVADGVCGYQVDVSDAERVEEFAAAVVRDHGVPDVLVSNAGIGMTGPFLATTAGDWARIVGVNVFGVVHCARAFAPAMAERGSGHIVNVASAAAFAPSRSLSAYGATKSAVVMFSECLRGEMAGHGVGVTVVCPGRIRTPITEATRFVGRSPEEEAQARARMTTQYRKALPPETVAAAILKAVRTNPPLVSVGLDAKAAHALWRVAPGIMRRLARNGPADQLGS